jgi:hypothetical protein
MANQQLKGPRYKYASVDTAPGADGYWSEPVGLSQERAPALFANVAGGGSATVTMQYKLPYSGSAWTDYTTDETLESGGRFRLDDMGGGVKWRMGVKNGDYTSGTVVVGFDW